LSWGVGEEEEEEYGKHQHTHKKVAQSTIAYQHAHGISN